MKRATKPAGEHVGIKWRSLERSARKGRRRELILVYSLAAGEWKQLSAPAEVSTWPKFEQWTKAQLEGIAAGKPVARRLDTSGPTVAALHPQWLELRRLDPQVSGATYSDNRSVFRSQILPRWGAVSLTALEGHLQELRDWVRELARKYSPEHVSKVVGTFRIFLRDCRLEKWAALRSNPLDSDEVETVLPSTSRKREVVTVPWDVVQVLLDAPMSEEQADARNHTDHGDRGDHPVAVELRSLVRYALAANTGAGHAELSGCRVSDVLDLPIEKPHPRLQILRNFSKSAKPAEGAHGGNEIRATKNAFRMRAIPLNACARAALLDWLEWGWEFWVGRAPRPTDPLLPDDHGQFSRPDYAERLRLDLEGVGQPTHDTSGRPYDFRALRRTFSTTLAANKVGREYREQLMGQRSDSVNSAHYTAEVPTELFDAVGRLPWSWRKRRPPGSALDPEPGPHGGGRGGKLGGSATTETADSADSSENSAEPLTGLEPVTSALRKRIVTRRNAENSKKQGRNSPQFAGSRAAGTANSSVATTASAPATSADSAPQPANSAGLGAAPASADRDVDEAPETALVIAALRQAIERLQLGDRAGALALVDVAREALGTTRGFVEARAPRRKGSKRDAG